MNITPDHVGQTLVFRVDKVRYYGRVCAFAPSGAVFVLLQEIDIGYDRWEPTGGVRMFEAEKMEIVEEENTL